MKHSTPQLQLYQIKITVCYSRLVLWFETLFHRLSYLYHRHFPYFDRYAYSIRLLDIEFLLKAFGFFGSGKLILEVGEYLFQEDGSLLYILPLAVLVAAFIIVGYAMVRQMRSWKRNVTEVLTPASVAKSPADTLLSERYVKNGYHVLQDEGTKKHYIMSRQVNRILYEDRWHRYLSFDGTFFLPEQCVRIAPYYLDKAYREKKSRGTAPFR